LFDGPLAGQHDENLTGAEGANLLEQFHPAEVWHAEVGNNYGGVERGNPLERLEAVRRSFGDITPGMKQLG
jgi:hypothetical protein